MKKILISIAAFLFAFQLSNAQTEKGTQNLGINLGASYNSSRNFYINVADNSTYNLDSKTNGFNIGPSYSYFITDKVDIGIDFSYNTLTNTNSTGNLNFAYYPQKTSFYNYSGNIFIRKYYMYKSKIGLRTGAFVGYSNGNSTTTYTTNSNNDSKSVTNAYNGGLKLDMVYYPTNRLGVSATLANLSYQHYKINNGAQGHQDGDSLNFYFVNNSLSLSVFYVIGKK